MNHLIVVGGGPAGLAAAVRPAATARHTTLIERYGFLGGLPTTGLVNPFMPWRLGSEPLVGGIFQEMLDRLASLGGYDYARWGDAFDTEALKLAADRLCQEAGVCVRLHTLLTGARVKEGSIISVTTESKSGRESLARRPLRRRHRRCRPRLPAGVPCDEGRAQDGRTQPMTLCFRMARVDVERMPASPKHFNELFDRAKDEGRITCPREDVLWFLTLHPDVVHFNTTRVVGLSPVRRGPHLRGIRSPPPDARTRGLLAPRRLRFRERLSPAVRTPDRDSREPPH